MALSPAALLDFLRRDKVKDPFGGDDLFDGESRFAGKGPKIALAASGVFLVLIVGFVGAAFLLGDSQTVPGASGSLSDLAQEEDTTSEALAPAPAQAPAVADATAATDRSASRRPWLAPTTPPPEAGKRLGPNEPPPPAAKPAAPTPPPPAPEIKTAAAPPPAETPQPAAEDEASVPKDIAGIPALTAPGVVPGAPKRFDLPSGADTGPTAAGGRPRLAEPPIPPTDRVAVAAPPPRFAALIDSKKDAKVPLPAAGAAKLAIVVDGLGLSQSATEAAITKLPPAVTLAFSPYARDLKKWMEKAKANGHEVLIEVPMESKDFPATDPGPLGLLTTNDAKDNQEHIDTIIKAAGNALGVLDSDGSKFREDPAINTLFAKLKEHNLVYVQGEPGVRLGEASVPTAVADVVADERPFRAAVDARLDYAERLAKYQGSAVASMSAKPVSFERLVLWIEQSQKKGVTLTPISQVLIR